MRRPNASYLEMEAIKMGFGCGRCYEVGMSWEGLMLHYIRQKDLYVKIHESPSQLAEAGVIYNDAHDPESHPGRQMVQYRSTPPGESMFGDRTGRLEVCKLCAKISTIQGLVALSKREMVRHLLGL
ncbi:hypothetical protein RSAG8_10862, partial [Rhizoctonia solani AG-8 WAC10335]